MQEIWKDIPDYEGLYQASDLGQVRSLNREVPMFHGLIKRKTTRKLRGKIIRQYKNKNGYMSVSLSANGKHKTHRVHRLVMLSFVGVPPNEKNINHKDGNKANNCLSNLEYVTRSENQIHAYTILGVKAKGPKIYGEKNHASVLTRNQVVEIHRMSKSGKSHRSIARYFDITHQAVGYILRGRNWPHIHQMIQSGSIHL